MDTFTHIIQSTGLAYMKLSHVLMIFVGGLAIYLAIVKKYSPLLLVPIGFGVIVGNLPHPPEFPIGVYDDGSVLHLLYYGVITGIFPSLIFLGIGALIDFSALISSPKSMLLGAAAKLGIFITYMGALLLGFTNKDAASIGIIGGADGPISIYLTSMLSPHLLGPVAIAAYSYMALVPVILPPIMKLLTTEKERKIRMKPARQVTKTEKILFPIITTIIAALITPGSLPLIGMLMLGNLLKETHLTDRLARTAGNALLDICTIILAFAVGASTEADVFLTAKSVGIFSLGFFAFATATFSGVLFGKIMNLFLKEQINPLIGAAGIAAVPESARVAEKVGLASDRENHLLMHAMGPNVAGVIGSAIVAGVFIALFR
jgi:carboxybiotin decarboxylase